MRRAPNYLVADRFNLVPDVKSDSAASASRIRNAGVLVLALLVTVCSEPAGPNQRVTSLDVSLDSALVYTSDSILAHAVAHDAQGNAVVSATITWSSRNGGVATVSPVGRIKAIHGGRTSIIADAGAARDSLIVIVLRRGVTVVSPRLDTLIFIKQSHQLAAATSDSTGLVAGSYLWASRDASLVSVTQSGRIVARANGATWIVATEDGGSRDSARVVVRQRAVRVIVTPAVISRPLARTQQFSAVALDSGGAVVPGLTTTWSSDVPGVAIIDAAGLGTAGGTGLDTIRALMGGAGGHAVLTVSPLPLLHFTRDTFDVGVGQYATSFDLPTPRVLTDSTVLDEAFFTHLSVAETAIAVVPESLPVRDYFLLAGSQTGLTSLTASAPAYVPANAAIRVSTPRLSHMFVATFDTVATNEFLPLRVNVSDSLGYNHFMVGPLTVVAQSSDTTVVRPQLDTLTVVPNDIGVNTALLPSGAGAAWVRYEAAGYRPDSIHVVVVQPRLKFVQPTTTPLSTATIGLGQFLGGGFAFVQTGSVFGPDTVTISISQRHPERLVLPPNLLQQAVRQGTRADLQWTGTGLGVDTLVASAPGYLPDTMLVYVTGTRYVGCRLSQSWRSDQLASISLLPADSTGATHGLAAPVRAVVTSSDTTVLKLASDTVAVVNDFTCSTGVTAVVMKRVGTATLTFTDPAGVYQTLVTPPITVQPTPLVIGLGHPLSHRTALGMHQRLSRDSIPTVAAQDFQFSPVAVHLRSTNPAVATVSPANLTITTMGTQNFEITGGDTTGTAWIVAEGPAAAADSMLVEVGRPQFVVRGRGVGPDSIYAIGVEVRDQLGNRRITAESVVAAITSSNFTYLVADSSSLTVPAGAESSASSRVRYLTPGYGILRASDPRAAYYRYEPGSTGVLPRSP
jgi:hypothetical protein